MRYQDVIENFIAGQSAKSGNYESDGKSLFLYGKCIAERVVESSQVNFVVTVADYISHTVVKALNCLPGIRVHTSKGQLYLNNMAWDGEKTSVRALEVKTGEEFAATAKRLLTQEQFDDGRTICNWLVENKMCCPDKVLIHSQNHVGAKAMKEILSEIPGIEVFVLPYEGANES